LKTRRYGWVAAAVFLTICAIAWWPSKRRAPAPEAPAAKADAAGYAQALAILDASIAKGVWEESDRAQFVAVASQLSPEQVRDLRARVSRASSEGKIKLMDKYNHPR
jgi:hypothetical protein